MARPKSLDKKNAILEAAMEVFAERGLESSPTSEISRRAGVAEGTLFTYFKTKDDLINALYRELKLEMADAMLSGFPRKKSVRQRVEHVWNGFITWSISHGKEKKVLDLLKTSERLTEETKAIGMAPFVEVEDTAREAIEHKIIEDLPLEFVGASMTGLAEATICLMLKDPDRKDFYLKSGFDFYWKGLARS